ncbi:NADH-quinone oxidoreductase subunit NuoF [soil metagenome]
MADAVLLTATASTTVDEFCAAGGGQGLQRALRVGPEQVIDEVTWAGLRGRGGGGFPTGIKWRTVRDAACPTTYVVCNAAEGEPGTFKDRWLLRRNPYLVLEGLAVAAYAVGASRAFIATKAIFETENEAVERAMDELADQDLLGSVPIELVRGPDAYLYGEETAMLEVLEGRAPLPRILPPYQVGLFARPRSSNPTAVNNVETLAHVALIARDGGRRFHQVGTDTSRGTMLFTLSGDVRRLGVYELPLGGSLAELIHDVGGGPPDDRDVKAVFPGASAAVIPGDQLDVPLDFDAMSAAGTGLGSGGFVVYDEDRCIVAATAAFVRFLATGSCGQCPACEQGALTIMFALEDIERGDGTQDHLQLIRRRFRSVTGGARCGLPVGTSAITGSALDVFGAEFERHLGRRCSSSRRLAPPRLVGSDEAAAGFVIDERPAVRDQDVAGVG